MDKEYQDQYYDLTPDAEDIDKVLTDLVDILNKKENSGWFVKYVVEDEPHFELGEGSGGSTYIPGEGDQLVAADGEGKAKANVGRWFSKLDNKTAILQTNYPTIEFLGDNGNATSYYVERTGPHIKIENGSLIQLLANGQDSPVISLTDNAIIEMGGTRSTASAQNAYTRSRTDQSVSTLTKKIFGSWSGPFGKTKIYPYLHMGQSSTILTEGCSLLKMSDGSCLLIEGNATMDIKGADAQGDRDSLTGGLYHPSEQYGETYFGMMPGSWFKMQSSSSTYGPMILIESDTSTSTGGTNGQIILTAQRLMKLDQTRYSEEGPSTPHTESFINPPIRTSRIIGGTFNIKTQYALNYPLTQLISYNQDTYLWASSSSATTLSSYLRQPTFITQGKTSVIIGDSGLMNLRMGTKGALTIDHTHEADSNVDIKIGAGAKSELCIDFGNDSNASTYYKIAPKGGSTTSIIFDPMKTTTIKFSPEKTFALSITPMETYATWQWEKLATILESTDAFIQTNGNWHVENFSGNFILRGSKYYHGDHESQWETAWSELEKNPFDPINGTHLGRDWRAPIAPTREKETDSGAIIYSQIEPTLQLYDGANLCMMGLASNPSLNTNYRISRFKEDDDKKVQINTANPIFEMFGPSDLRLYNGASITMETKTDSQTFITFSSYTGIEDSVTFTLTELAKLKTLLSNDNFNKLIQLISEE